MGGLITKYKMRTLLKTFNAKIIDNLKEGGCFVVISTHMCAPKSSMSVPLSHFERFSDGFVCIMFSC